MTKQRLTRRMYLYFSPAEHQIAEKLKTVLNVESINSVVRAALARLAQAHGVVAGKEAQP